MELEHSNTKIYDILTNLKIMVQSNDDNLLNQLVLLLEELQNNKGSKICFSDDHISTFGTLLQHESDAVKTKIAEIIAFLAKKETFRERSTNTKLVSWICTIIKNLTANSIGAILHSCRALGNLCYENARNREYITESGGINLLMDVIRFANKLPVSEDEISELRSASLGLLLNYLSGHDDNMCSKALEAGVIDLLVESLYTGIVGQHGTNVGIHVLMMLEVFEELLAIEKKELLDEKLCRCLVRCLRESTPGELTELCIDLAHSQAEYPSVPLNLAKSGMVEVLMDLLEQYENISKNNDLRNIFKMTCDLISRILNDDETMRLLYDNAKGPVFNRLVEWMAHSNEDIQVTGVLAMGNFGRTDNNCIEMVKQGIHKKLLELLKKNNTETGDLTLQHALLSALRNLAIPAQNKLILYNEGILNVLYPMLVLTSFPVVFKLLGTMRLLTDGQEKVSCEMGKNKVLLTKLVEWCSVTEHPGVEGEAHRFLAWIIKNSRNRDVMGLMVECKAVPRLINMITSDHTIMQIEALLSLSLLSAMRLMDAENSFVEANIGSKLKDYLVNHNPEKEAFQNMLTLINQLLASGKVKEHLRQCALPPALTGFVKKSHFLDLKDQVIRLSTMLESD